MIQSIEVEASNRKTAEMIGKGISILLSFGSTKQWECLINNTNQINIYKIFIREKVAL